jgi:hypothetical protein
VPDGTTPSVTSTGITVKPTPLQTVELIAVIAGRGFTVITTVNAVPTQLPDVGVTMYVADCEEFVELVRVPFMAGALVPDAPPAIPPVTTGTDQLYVVPGGTTPLVILAGVKVKVPPLHIVPVIPEIPGFGFTVTITVKSVPAQLPDVGVTV